MSSETSLAFAALEARAAETSPLGADRISLRDFVRDVEIGAFQEERGVTQRLRFNVVVEVTDATAPVADDVDRILSYDTIVEAIELSVSEERLSLLETLAERIASLLLAEPRAERVFLRIEKLDRGPFTLGVEIERKRAEAPAVPRTDEAFARPLVLYLSNPAIADPRLPDWLNQIETLGRPVILTVGMPDRPRPKAGAALPQRRIDLLALEQNAWVLAARDRRCIVVDSRTELTHAIHSGGIVVWAPSKVVLDAVDGPDVGPDHPAELAAWFSAEVAAERFAGLGIDVPAGVRLSLDDRLDLSEMIPHGGDAKGAE